MSKPTLRDLWSAFVEAADASLLAASDAIHLLVGACCESPEIARFATMLRAALGQHTDSDEQD